MVRLNRNNLSKEQLDKLYVQLSRIVAPSDCERADSVLTELLGTEERIMLAKRLAAVVLLVEGVSKYKISGYLKISQSTVENISIKLEKGQFDKTLGVVGKTKKDYFKFLEVLDDVLHLGGILPHYSGLDRYRN